ncbi:MAG: hypothetical protein P4N24_12840 [Acidobacteriota bacterium]|nr:hypothetical protein [Acidobacteriota bacterium]
MEISLRALITLIHGMLFGAFFVMATYGLVVELYRSVYAEQPLKLTPQGDSRERLYLICMVGLGWAAVLTGAYVSYPWYRAVPPAGVTDLALYPRFLLKSSAVTAGWHDLGMEWKEHVAWIAPIAVTMVAYVLTRYRLSIREHPQVRTAILVFAVVALGAAGVAGFFGAMLNKYAPVNGGPTIHLRGKGQ